LNPLTRYRALAEACPGANEKLQVEGWFGQLADLNQDPGMRRCEKLMEMGENDIIPMIFRVQ